MDLQQPPTLKDLAKLLDTICVTSDGGFPQTLHALRWLIQSSPAALAIHDRLHARRERGPSLIELARLMLTVEDREPHPEAVHTLLWLIRRSPKAAELHRQLDRMADDAGLFYRENDWAVEAVRFNAEVDRLLATLDEWQDAREAIRLEDRRDYELLALLSICRARIARSDGDQRSRLERLRRRLQDAARREIENPEPEAELSQLQDLLRSMPDPAAALATVERLGRRREP